MKYVLSAIVVVVCGLGVIAALGHTDVVILRATHAGTVDFQVSLDRHYLRSNFSEDVLSAQLANISKKYVQSYPTSGWAASSAVKSYGTVQFTNAGSSFTLSRGTKLTSADGKVFVLSARTYIRPGTAKKPSITTAGVSAAVAGAAYNIPPTAFTVPGLRGTAYAAAVQVASQNAFTGGKDAGKNRIVTADDIAGAQEKFRSSFHDELRQEIAQGYPALVLVEPLAQESIVAGAARPAAGQQADTFTIEGDGTLQAILFSQADLIEAVKTAALRQESGDSVIPNLTITGMSAGSIDLAAGTATLSGSARYTAATAFSEDRLVAALRGKSVRDAQTYLQSVAGIQSAALRIFPPLFPVIPPWGAVTIRYASSTD